MYAKERRIDGILRAKDRDLQEVNDRLLAVENYGVVQEDRARREDQQYQRDVQAFQADADRLDNEYHVCLFRFKREDRKLQSQLVRGRADNKEVCFPSRFQRNYPPQRYRLSTARPSAGVPSPSVASASAPSPYKSAVKISDDARLPLRQQSQTFFVTTLLLI